MQNHKAIVDATLVGFPVTSVPAADEEAGKAQLTRAAAWNIYATAEASIRLLEKTSGNQIMNLSVDVIVDAVTGESCDIATADDDPDRPGYRRIKSQWLQRPPPAPPGRLVVPTADLASAPGPLGAGDEPEPGPDPEPAPDNDEILAELDVIQQQLEAVATQQANDTAAILARSDANTEKIQQQIAQVVEDAEETLQELLLLWLAGGLGGGAASKSAKRSADDFMSKIRDRRLARGQA